MAAKDSCTDSHEHHDHDHGPHCGHTAIDIEGSICYLHDGHLHKVHGDHVHCTSIEFSEQNPDGCNQIDQKTGHVHAKDCGHEAVPHGDHTDYLVDGRLQYQHGNHVDDHGQVKVIKK